MYDSEKRYLMDLTKDIVVSKLGNVAPNYSNGETGKSIGDMYEAIYTKISEIYFSDNADTEN